MPLSEEMANLQLKPEEKAQVTTVMDAGHAPTVVRDAKLGRKKGKLAAIIASVVILGGIGVLNKIEGGFLLRQNAVVSEVEAMAQNISKSSNPSHEVARYEDELLRLSKESTPILRGAIYRIEKRGARASADDRSIETIRYLLSMAIMSAAYEQPPVVNGRGKAITASGMTGPWIWKGGRWVIDEREVRSTERGGGALWWQLDFQQNHFRRRDPNSY